MSHMVCGQIRHYPPANEPHFRLSVATSSRDYLVPSLRDWLTLGKGKHGVVARVKLHERSALWGAKSERSASAELVGMIDIIALTRRSSSTSAQLAMMRTASWHHGLRWSVMLLMIVLALSAAFYWWEKRETWQSEQ